ACRMSEDSAHGDRDPNSAPPRPGGIAPPRPPPAAAPARLHPLLRRRRGPDAARPLRRPLVLDRPGPGLRLLQGLRPRLGAGAALGVPPRRARRPRRRPAGPGRTQGAAPPDPRVPRPRPGSGAGTTLLGATRRPPHHRRRVGRPATREEV